MQRNGGKVHATLLAHHATGIPFNGTECAPGAWRALAPVRGGRPGTVPCTRLPVGKRSVASLRIIFCGHRPNFREPRLAWTPSGWRPPPPGLDLCLVLRLVMAEWRPPPPGLDPKAICANRRVTIICAVRVGW